MQGIAERLLRDLFLLVRLRVHERVHAIVLIEILHRTRLEVCGRHLLVRVERALNDGARLDILDLRADESRALARLDMLEIDDLPNAAIDFDREARAEISTVNHELMPSNIAFQLRFT